MKKTFFSILILSAILLTSCSGSSTPVPAAEQLTDEISSSSVIAEGTLLPESSVELAFAQGGVVKEISAQSGDRVVVGDIIVKLVGAETAQAELVAAKLEQTLAQQALDALHRNALSTSSQTELVLLDAQKAYETESNHWNLGSTEDATDLELTLDDYVAVEEDYRDAREKLDSLLDKDEDSHERRDAQEDFDTEKESLTEAYADLLKAVAENDKPLDKKLANLLRAVGTLEAAREIQSRLNDSNLDPEILSAAESRLETAVARVAAAQAAAELYELRAPFNGTLLSFDLNIGEAVMPTVPVAFIADTSHWIVETKDLAEVDAANVAVGDSAIIKLDAFSGEEFPAKVTAIDPVGQLYLGDMTYKVTVTLDESDPRFMWNMTATVTILVK